MTENRLEAELQTGYVQSSTRSAQRVLAAELGF